MIFDLRSSADCQSRSVEKELGMRGGHTSSVQFTVTSNHGRSGREHCRGALGLGLGFEKVQSGRGRGIVIWWMDWWVIGGYDPAQEILAVLLLNE